MLVAEELLNEESLIPVETNAIGEASQQLRKRLQDELEDILRGSVYRLKDAALRKARGTIIAFADLRENWDSYGAVSPNRVSVANALRVVELLESFDFIPDRIVPSAEGGIGICFVRNDRYADIECSNEGDILGVYYVGMEMPRLLETDGTNNSINSALLRIRDHIRG